MKIKENEKSDKYLDLARELRKLWKLKAMVIPIVIGALRTIPKRLGKEGRRVRNQRISRDHPFRRSARILRRVMEIRGDLLSLTLL